MSILYPQVLIFVLALLFLYRKSRLLALSLALMIVALSRPVLTQSSQKENLQGREFIIALDISYSMRAKDIAPSRLEKAKEIIRHLLQANPHDRFSLFAFTTNPLILCPSTSDHQLLLTALDALNVDNILTHGTSLKKLFSRIEKLPMPEKNLILLSDGGEEKTVDKHDINLFSYILATDKGSMLKDTYGKHIKDDKGALLITRSNPLLKKISTLTLPYDSQDFSLDFIRQKTLSQKEKVGYYELFWIPLLLSLALFFLYFVKIPKKILALLPFLALQADAGLLDWYYLQKAQSSYHDKHYKQAVEYYEKVTHKTMQSQMNLANTYYRVGAFVKAQALYGTLKSSNPKIKKRLLFKLGNCAAQLGEYEKAKSYYLDALLFGKDADILHNLKVIAKKKKENLPVPKKTSHDKEKKKSSSASGKSKKGKKGDASSSAPSQRSHPLGFKAYELINKGYIDEKKPW